MVYYVEFGDYCRIAAEVLGVEPEQVAALPNIAANGHPLIDADPDTDVPMVERIAAGEATPTEVARWLQARISSSE